MKILSAQQIKEVDSITIENEPISSIDLMERASNACVDWISKHFNTNYHFAIFCGTGNNGGDGLAIARLLKLKHYSVTVYIMNNVAYSDNVEENFELWQKLDGRTVSIKLEDDFPKLNQPQMIVVDALFGSGINRSIKGLAAELITHINKCDQIVISIDTPSGLHVENNATNLHSPIVKATYTLSLELPKLALLLPENKEFSGTMHILPIGLDKDAIAKQDSHYEWVTLELFQNIIKVRNRFSHKGNYGHVKIVAGSKGKIGAGILATKAALKSGAGLVTLETPECGYTSVQSSVVEAMAISNGENYISERIDLDNYVFGIGPGLGKEDKTATEIIRLISRTTEPMVIDADAINILAKHKDDWNKIPPFSILTPHPKELERWIGTWNSDIEKLERTAKLAHELNCFIIIKGGYSVTVTPKGKFYFNSTGKSGMATAGSGDVLTGILAGLLAQGYTSEQCCLLGVYLHGLAGDFAKEKIGENSMIASDIIENLSFAFKAVTDAFIPFNY